MKKEASPWCCCILQRSPLLAFRGCEYFLPSTPLAMYVILNYHMVCNM